MIKSCLDLEMIMCNFGQAFREFFYKEKGFKSCYQLCQVSQEIEPDGHGITASYLSKMMNNPILIPHESTLKKLANAFVYQQRYTTYKNRLGNDVLKKRAVDEELQAIRKFFEQQRQIYQQQRQIYQQKEMNQMQSYAIALKIDSDNISEFNKNILPKVMELLESVATELIIHKQTKKGSIILSLESSTEAFEKIMASYQSGELATLLGYPVLKIDVTPNKSPVILTQWLSGIFETGWRNAEDLLSAQQLRPAMVWSEPIKRAKLYDLQVNLISHQVVLLVNLLRENEEEVIVNVKVYPNLEEYLPPNFKLLILSEGEVFKEVTARSNDSWIQCEFDANFDDEFTVGLGLGDVIVSENFVV